VVSFTIFGSFFPVPALAPFPFGGNRTSSSSDGSQSVTVDLLNPGNVQFTAFVWAWENDTYASQAFFVTPSTPPGLISSPPLWFAESQLSSNTYDTVEVSLPPNAGIRGVRLPPRVLLHARPVVRVGVEVRARELLVDLSI
jgi:hypothetical protein